MHVLAADGGGEAVEGIGRFHREVGPEGEARSRGGHRAPGVGPAEPLRSKPHLRHAAVGCLVDGLHRRDDAAATEAGNVGDVDDLRMLDPPAPVAGVGPRQLLDSAQHLRVGGVADRVHRELEAVHRGAAHQVAELGVVEELQPAHSRRVRVGRLEPRPPRPQRAVGV